MEEMINYCNEEAIKNWLALLRELRSRSASSEVKRSDKSMFANCKLPRHVRKQLHALQACSQSHSMFLSCHLVCVSRRVQLHQADRGSHLRRPQPGGSPHPPSDRPTSPAPARVTSSSSRLPLRRQHDRRSQGHLPQYQQHRRLAAKHDIADERAILAEACDRWRRERGIKPLKLE